MNALSKTLFTLAGLGNGLLGMWLSVFPEETILVLIPSPPTAAGILLIKVSGALFFGFGVLGYMSRGSHLGGIYGRPIVFSTGLSHLIIGVQSLKFLYCHETPSPQLLTGFSLFYLVLGIGIGALLFRSPV